MLSEIVTATIVVIPTTLAAAAAWRKAGKAEKKLQTSNGLTIGKMVEGTYNRMERMEGKLDTHIMDPWIHGR